MLDLNDCEALESLPPILGDLAPTLTALVLDDCYALVALPASLACCAALQSLNLYDLLSGYQV